MELRPDQIRFICERLNEIDTLARTVGYKTAIAQQRTQIRIQELTAEIRLVLPKC